MNENVYRINYELETSYWWFVARNLIVMKLVERYSDLRQGDLVFDVGCGTGGFAMLLQERYKVVGLDTSPLAIEFSKWRGLNNIYLSTLEEFSTDDEPKAIFFLDVLEHIEDDYQTVAKAYELLQKGGNLVVTVPAYSWLWSAHDELHMHKRRYTISSLKKLILSKNFQIKYISYFNTFLFLPAVLKRIFARSKPLGDVQPVDPVSPLVNSILKRVFLWEAFFLKFMRFPFGLSIICIAKKL